MDEINEWKREMDDIQCNKDKQFVRQKCVIDCCLEEASTKSKMTMSTKFAINSRRKRIRVLPVDSFGWELPLL